MDVITRHIITKKIKTPLVFFAFILLVTCRQNKVIEGIVVNHEQDKAVSVSFSSNEEILDFKIFVTGNTRTPVLGKYSMNEDVYTFTPAVPFSDNQSYSIHGRKKLIAQFNTKPSVMRNTVPEIVAIYPSADTIPENLLKMYLFFSEPMEEVGKSLDYIKVSKNNDTEPLEVFLELESELWNGDHTRLTLWLDPGRIKTDLIPNKEKGLPIVKGNTYKVKIDRTWRSANGISQSDDVIKTYYVANRDSIKPSESSWKVETPTLGLRDELIIDFGESLDAVLSKECIEVLDESNKRVAGNYALVKAERYLVVVPTTPWKKGNYTIAINTRLEDLAGNNLNRNFDVDIKSTKQNGKLKNENYLKFSIN